MSGSRLVFVVTLIARALAQFEDGDHASMTNSAGHTCEMITLAAMLQSLADAKCARLMPPIDSQQQVRSTTDPLNFPTNPIWNDTTRSDETTSTEDEEQTCEIVTLATILSSMTQAKCIRRTTPSGSQQVWSSADPLIFQIHPICNRSTQLGGSISVRVAYVLPADAALLPQLLCDGDGALPTACVHPLDSPPFLEWWQSALQPVFYATRTQLDWLVELMFTDGRFTNLQIHHVWAQLLALPPIDNENSFLEVDLTYLFCQGWPQLPASQLTPPVSPETIQSGFVDTHDTHAAVDRSPSSDDTDLWSSALDSDEGDEGFPPHMDGDVLEPGELGCQSFRRWPGRSGSVSPLAFVAAMSVLVAVLEILAAANVKRKNAHLQSVVRTLRVRYAHQLLGAQHEAALLTGRLAELRQRQGALADAFGIVAAQWSDQGRALAEMVAVMRDKVPLLIRRVVVAAEARGRATASAAAEQQASSILQTHLRELEMVQQPKAIEDMQELSTQRLAEVAEARRRAAASIEAAGKRIAALKETHRREMVAVRQQMEECIAAAEAHGRAAAAGEAEQRIAALVKAHQAELAAVRQIKLHEDTKDPGQRSPSPSRRRRRFFFCGS